jgi:hypothetical protein
MWHPFHSANLARLSETTFGALPLLVSCYHLDGSLLWSICCWRQHWLVTRYQHGALAHSHADVAAHFVYMVCLPVLISNTMPAQTCQAPVGALIDFFESKTAHAETDMGNSACAVQQIIEMYTQREPIIGTRRKFRPDPDGGDDRISRRKRRKLLDSLTDLDGSGLHELKRRDSVHTIPFGEVAYQAPRNDTAEVLLNRKLATWLSFASQQPEAQHTDLSILDQLVSRASTVGNSDALCHLQRTLLHWRQLASSSTSTALYRPDTSSRLSTSTEKFRYHYRRMEHASTQAIDASMTRRYCAARMRAAFNEHMALCAYMTPGRQESTVLSDLFALVFPRAAGDAWQAQKWHAFRRTLKAGKRWLALEEAFSCGVFALLPEASVPCSYVERGLTDDLFAVWCRVLQRCCPVVGHMADMAAPFVRRLAEDLPPEGEGMRMRLEAAGDVPQRKAADVELAGLLEVVWGETGDKDESAWFI